MRHWFSIAVVVGVVSAAVTPHLAAHEVARDLRRMQRHTFTVDEGLPNNGIEAIAQTGDGYMWFGTLKGLSRFDGVRFTNFTDANSALTPDTVFDIAAGPHNDVWIAHRSLSHYENGKFTTFGPKSGLPPILHVAVAKDGTVWAMSRRNMLRYDGRKFQMFGAKEGLPREGLSSFCIDTSGRVWVGTMGLGGYVLDDDHFRMTTARDAGA